MVKGSNNGGAVGDAYLLGAQAVSAPAAAGQKVVAVAATAQFAVGQQVLLVEWTGSPPDENFIACEVAEIDTISEDTSLTMVTELLHAYSTAHVCLLWVDGARRAAAAPPATRWPTSPEPTGACARSLRCRCAHSHGGPRGPCRVITMLYANGRVMSGAISRRRRRRRRRAADCVRTLPRPGDESAGFCDLPSRQRPEVRSR